MTYEVGPQVLVFAFIGWLACFGVTWWFLWFVLRAALKAHTHDESDE